MVRRGVVSGPAVATPVGTIDVALGETARARVRRKRFTEAADWPRTTRLLPWLVAGFIVMLYLFPFNDTDLPVTLPFDVRLDRILLVLILGVWFVDSFSTRARDQTRRRWTGPQIAALAFLLVAITSDVLNWQVLFTLSELGPAIKKLALLISYLLFLFVVATVIRPSELRGFAKLIVGLATLEGLSAIYEYRAHVNLLYNIPDTLIPGVSAQVPAGVVGVSADDGRYNVIGSTGHPLALTAMLAMTLPVAIVMLIEARDRRTQIFSAIASAVIFAGSIATLRKSSFVIAVPVLLVLAIYYRSRILRLLPVGIVIAASVHVLAPGALGSVADEVKPGNLTNANGTQQRLSDYDAVALDVFRHPLLGRGYQTWQQPEYRYLDNEYLGLLLETGAIGVLCYLAMIGTAAFASLRVARQRDPVRSPLAVAAGAGVIAFAVASELFDVLGFPQVPYVFFLLIGLVVVCVRAGPTAREVAAP